MGERGDRDQKDWNSSSLFALTTRFELQPDELYHISKRRQEKSVTVLSFQLPVTSGCSGQKDTLPSPEDTTDLLLLTSPDQTDPPSPAGTPANPRATSPKATNRLKASSAPEIQPAPHSHSQLYSRNPAVISISSLTQSLVDLKDLLQPFITMSQPPTPTDIPSEHSS